MKRKGAPKLALHARRRLLDFPHIAVYLNLTDTLTEPEEVEGRAAKETGATKAIATLVGERVALLGGS